MKNDVLLEKLIELQGYWREIWRENTCFAIARKIYYLLCSMASQSAHRMQIMKTESQNSLRIRFEWRMLNSLFLGPPPEVRKKYPYLLRRRK